MTQEIFDSAIEAADNAAREMADSLRLKQAFFDQFDHSLKKQLKDEFSEAEMQKFDGLIQAKKEAAWAAFITKDISRDDM